MCWYKIMQIFAYCVFLCFCYYTFTLLHCLAILKLNTVAGSVCSSRASFECPPTNSWDAQTHTHTHPFNGPSSGTTQVSRYQKGKTNLDFTEEKDSEWQWHQLGHTCKSAPCFRQITMPVPHHSVYPSCHPTNSVKALMARLIPETMDYYSLALFQLMQNNVCPYWLMY